MTTPSGTRLTRPLVLLTDRRFVVSKPKTLGAAQVDFEVEWRHCQKVSTNLHNGDMMRVQVDMYTDAGTVRVITDPTDAYEVETRTRDAYWPFRH